MKKLVGLCLLCVFGVVPSASAQYMGGSGDGYDSASSEPLGSTTRYVAPTGSNAFNNCTDQAHPCATIAHAVSHANDGDTLNLAGGTYNEPGLTIEKELNIEGQGVIVQ